MSSLPTQLQLKAINLSKLPVRQFKNIFKLLRRKRKDYEQI